MGSEISLFMVAMGLAAPLTFVPLFASKLTDSPLAIGAVTAAFQIGWLPQVFVAGYVERSARKWPWVIVFGGLERLPSLGLAVCALAAASVDATIVLGAVYLLCFSQLLCGGFATTPWLDVVARTVPPRWRGQFLGGFTMLGTILGAGAAALAAPLLNWYPFPYGFAALFGLAFVVFAISWVLLLFVVEPPGPPPRPRRAFHAHLTDLGAVLVADRAFSRFVGGVAGSALGMMSGGFLVVYASTALGATDEQAAWYTAALLLGQTLGNLVLGRLGDQHGMARVGQAAALGGASIAGVALLAPDATWLLAAFFLLGAAQAGNLLARLSGPIEQAPPERRPTYVALSSALVGLAAAVAPLIGGQVVASLSYTWLFVLSAVVSLSAIGLLGAGAKPRRASSEDAARDAAIENAGAKEISA